jgi:hypothetical protein
MEIGDNLMRFKNANFFLGLICLVIFMSGGVVVFVMAISEGQLMYSPIGFFIAPIPFGVAFSIFAYKFLQKIREKTKQAKFISITLIIDMVLVCWVYLLFMGWIEFWGVLRWM